MWSFTSLVHFCTRPFLATSDFSFWLRLWLVSFAETGTSPLTDAELLMLKARPSSPDAGGLQSVVRQRTRARADAWNFFALVSSADTQLLMAKPPPSPARAKQYHPLVVSMRVCGGRGEREWLPTLLEPASSEASLASEAANNTVE